MLDLNRAQKEICKAARDFARGEFDKDLALEMESAGAFPERLWQKAGELGFLGLHFPEQYGGGGLGLLDAVLVAETFCRQDSSIGAALLLAGFGAECVLHSGSEEVKRKFLPAVAEGRARCGLAITEAGAGQNDAALKTQAVITDNHWVVNGAKSYVLNAAAAAFYIVACRTPPDETSLLLIESNRPGATVCGLGRMVGLNMNGAARLDLVDVQAPRENLLGEPGKGPAQLQRCMDDAYVLVGAAALGMAAGALDQTLAYVTEREVFSRKLAVFEITRDKIAAMAAKTETARAIVYEAARRQDRGGAGTLPAIAKMTATRAAVEVADEAIQLFGGYGYMKETEVERFYRDAKMLDLLIGGPAAARKTIAAALIR